MSITIAILILSGVVIFFMGYLIRKKQCLWLLCEYREGRVEDIDGLAKWAGILAYLMASVLVLTGLLYHFFPGRVLVITLVMWFIVMKLVIIMLVGSQKYMRKGTKSTSKLQPGERLAEDSKEPRPSQPAV
jgi:hypothetical protein